MINEDNWLMVGAWSVAAFAAAFCLLPIWI